MLSSKIKVMLRFKHLFSDNHTVIVKMTHADRQVEVTSFTFIIQSIYPLHTKT